MLEWKDNLIPYKYSFFIWYARYIEKVKVKKSDFIVVESIVLKNMLIEKYSLNKTKIHVSLNAVNSTEFTDIINSTETNKWKDKFSNPKKIIVSYLGSFAFYHNCKLLVEAAKVLSNINPNIGILMVGDGKHKKECESLANQYGLINNTILFLPPVLKSEVPIILKASDICVLPGSTDIICPIKIMEYMASGRATVAPNYACNKEVIKQNETGILFDADNINSLVNVIHKLAEDSALRNKIGDNGQKYAVDYLSWKKTWGNTLKNILNETSD